MKREIHDILKRVLSDAEDRDVVIIEGARQVGKSYLVQSVLADMDRPHLAFDLEKDARTRREISNTEDFNDFLALMTDRYNLQAGSILFFDEAQECPKLAEYVKSFKEDLKDVRVVLTGSSMNRFFPKSVRMPVGRTKSLCVFGFSFTEFVRFVKGDELSDFIRSAPEHIPKSRHELLLDLFDAYLITGGYPEAVKAYLSGQPPRTVLEDIIAALEEDFERKEAYRPGLFRHTLRAIANHTGSPSKLTHLDATKYHAKQVIEAMKSWHIILEVEYHCLDPNRSAFLPKRYLHDIGVANMLRSLAVPAISLVDTIEPVMRQPLGGLFENAVLINLLSGMSAFKTISGWKRGKQAGIEVDFIADAPDSKNKIPIECKAATSVNKSHGKNLAHYLRATGQRFGVLVSAAPLQTVPAEEGRKILNLPCYLACKSNIDTYFQRAPSPPD